MKLRYANSSDIDDVLIWRNDELTRKMFKSNHIVNPVEHCLWFQNTLSDPLMAVFIGVDDGVKVGICHFKCNDDYVDAEVSINLNPIMRKKNLAEIFLRQAMYEFFKTRRINLTAEIKKNNISSARVFQKCGFILIGEDNNFYCYRYEQADGTANGMVKRGKS